MLTAVTGINWGDEGKGRVIDLLAENADVVVRYQGGNNAGHTVVTDNCKFVLNLLPSGILHPDVTCVLGDGMVVDLDHLENEIESIREKGIVISPQNLKLSKHATISMPWHKFRMNLKKTDLQKQVLPLVLHAAALHTHTAINIRKKHCASATFYILTNNIFNQD